MNKTTDIENYFGMLKKNQDPNKVKKIGADYLEN